MSRVRVFLGGGAHGFPRVSGDEPLEVLDGYVLLTFSPRERG